MASMVTRASSALVRPMATAVAPVAAAGASIRHRSCFADVAMAPPDSILGLTDAFKKDSDSSKINVGVGAYRDEEGRPHKLDSVREAQKRIVERDMDLEYAGITGIPEFVRLATEFAYGSDSAPIREGRLAAAQSLSGTGALRVIMEFLAQELGEGTRIYMPNKTWGNHNSVAKRSGLTPETYRYYNAETCGLDIDGLLADLKALDEGSVVLLHACAHNPTGVDPTQAQWNDILDIVKARNHRVLFDSAYQGFATGDAEADAFAIRLFADAGVDMMLCQSFAKNFGLYGERVGALSVVCERPEDAERVLSQLKVVIRSMYSNPPIGGARIVTEVLGDEKLRAQWYRECKAMADRIAGARSRLREEVERLGAGRDWSHITSQIGMFCFSGLTPEQCDVMVSKHHVYMTRDGRISMAGVTQSNAPRIAAALHEVTSRV